MAQRIFRSDDTSKWREKYGKGKIGTVAPSGTTTDDQSVSSVNGSNATKTLNYSNFTGVAPVHGDILFIIQATGTGAMTEPNYELNVVDTFDGSHFYTKYNLTRDWNAGAQAYILRQHKNWNLDSGAVINIRTFDGNVGGFLIRLASKKIYINVGTIQGIGIGFNGGGNEDTGANPQARAGATPSNNSNPAQSGANEGGGGGARDNGGGQGASGGGAGNATAGVAGGANSGHTPGSAGAQLTKTQLKIITISPGGGGGIGPGGNDNGGFGGDGSGSIILIAPDIEITDNAVINIQGEAGNTDQDRGGSQGSGGGGGAAADLLAKGERVKLGNGRINNQGGVGGASNSGNPAGGNGSPGYVHVDYARSLTGSPQTGTFTSRQDKSLNRRPSGAGLFIFLQKFMSR